MRLNKSELKEIQDKADIELREAFSRLDELSRANTEKVLEAFARHRVSEPMLHGSTGYGYGDRGRETLDEIYADVMGTESAFVRHNIVNGTHALNIALFGLLRPGDTLLSVTGKPYDTLDEAIGAGGANGDGSLADFGVKYRQSEMGVDFSDKLDSSVKVVFIQRSRGYMTRRALSVREINEIYNKVKSRTDAYVVVDNCYGEFTETVEPKADLLVGSLIKNPGGGMAESGAYIAGSEKAVRLASYRMTSVGIGTECGATLDQNKNIFKGLFYAPHTTVQALKTAVYAAYVFEKAGYTVSPAWNEERHDIIQTITFGNEADLCAFCRGIQKGSPVDAFATPEPWDMPGYTDKVIMAAGAFVQGASIELSADAPIRPPFCAYFQGGLTYESGRYGINSAAGELCSGK